MEYKCKICGCVFECERIDDEYVQCPNPICGAIGKAGRE